MDLQALHHRLRLHFKVLSDERGGVRGAGGDVFLIEHGLTAEEQSATLQMVVACLAEHPLEDEPFWNTRYLPVLVLLVEQIFTASGEPEQVWLDLTMLLQTPVGSRAQTVIGAWLRVENRSRGGLPTAEPVAVRLAFREAFMPAAGQRVLASLLVRWSGTKPSPPLPMWFARQVARENEEDIAVWSCVELLRQPGAFERIANELAGLPVRPEDAAAERRHQRVVTGLRDGLGADGERLVGPPLKIEAAKATLEGLQLQLMARYSELQGMRAGLGVAVYAIEHPLDSAAMQSLESALCVLTRHSPDDVDAFWLCVVALAADVAFDYEKPYWPLLLPRVGIALEDAAPRNWRVPSPAEGFKDALKLWFERFASRYGGPRPSGRWAESFNQICWPIANAGLARAFRRDLTRLLLDCAAQVEERLDLAAFQPRYFARILKARLTNPSERFRVFCEDDALVEFAARSLLSMDAPGVALDPAFQERILVALREELALAKEGQAGTELEALRRRTGARTSEAAPVRYAAQRHSGKWYLQATIDHFPVAANEALRLRYLTAAVGGRRCTAAQLIGEPLLLEHRQIALSVVLSSATRDEELCLALREFLTDTRLPSRLLLKVDPEDPDLAIRTRAIGSAGTYLLLTTSPVPAPWKATDVGTSGMEGFCFEADAASVHQAATAAGLPAQSVPPVDVWIAGRPRDEELMAGSASEVVLAVRSASERLLSVVVRAGRAGSVVWESTRAMLPAGTTRSLVLPSLPDGQYSLGFRLEHDQLSLTTVALRVAPAPARVHSGAIFVLPGSGLAEAEFVEELTADKTIEVHAPEGTGLELRLEAWESDEPPPSVRRSLSASLPVSLIEQFEASLPGSVERAWKLVAVVEAAGQALWERDFLRERRVRWVKNGATWDILDQRFAGPEATPVRVEWASAAEPWCVASVLARDVPRPFPPGLYVLEKQRKSFNLAGVVPVIRVLPPAERIFAASRHWLSAAQHGTTTAREERLRLARACVGALSQSLLGVGGEAWFHVVETPALAGGVARPPTAGFSRAGLLREWAEGPALAMGRSDRMRALSGFLNVNQSWVDAVALGLSSPNLARWEPKVDANRENLGDWARRLSQVPRPVEFVTGVRLAVLWLARAAGAEGQQLDRGYLYPGWGRSFWSS